MLKQNIFVALATFHSLRNICLKCFQYEYEMSPCNYQRHRAVVFLFFSLHFFHSLLLTAKLPLSHNAHVYACVCMSVSISAEVRGSSPIHCNPNCSVSSLVQFSRLSRIGLDVVVLLLLHGRSTGPFRHPGEILGLL